MDDFCGLNDSDDLAAASSEEEEEEEDEVANLAPTAGRLRRRAPHIFEKMESVVGIERSARAFVWRGQNMMQPDVALVDICGVGLCATRDYGKHETVFFEEAAEAVVLNDVKHCSRCLRSLVECDSWDVPSRCCGDPVTSSPGSSAGKTPAERLAAHATKEYAYLCGDARSARRLGLSERTDAAGKMALNCFEVRLASPFQAFHQDLVRKHGRGTREMRQALQEFAKDNGIECTDEAIREFAAPHVAALFTLTSCINHDCDPNCRVVTGFLTPSIELETLRPVLRGEQLTISYIPSISTLTNTARRRKRLQTAYLFDCACDRCSTC